jgi:hypothetical protein
VDIVDIGRISNINKDQVANASYCARLEHRIAPLKIEITMASRGRNTESCGFVALKLRQAAKISIV